MARVLVDGKIRYLTPRARKVILNTGASLEAVSGSGPNGRVVEADVANIKAEVRPLSATASVSPVGRQAIARRTVASSRDIPHFFLQLEISAEPVVRLRQQILGEMEGEQIARISLTDFFLAAVGNAIVRFPDFNAIWRNESVEKLQAANVGLIVRTDSGGLLIPVIAAVNKLDLFSLATSRKHAVEEARKSKLSPQNQSAAVSITNLGASSVDSFLPIIDKDQSMMLAVGSVATRPWVNRQKQLTACDTVKLCLAVDHRVHDGAPAAQFLEAITDELEHPVRLLVRKDYRAAR